MVAEPVTTFPFELPASVNTFAVTSVTPQCPVFAVETTPAGVTLTRSVEPDCQVT